LSRRGRLDRLRAGVVSGPVGRGVAFVVDFGVALAQAARERLRGERG
jgi:hypothetical protein